MALVPATCQDVRDGPFSKIGATPFPWWGIPEKPSHEADRARQHKPGTARGASHAVQQA